MRFVWAVAVLLLCAVPAHGEGRPWTDTSGNFHVVADLTDVQNGRVYLKESNGRTVAVPLAKMSPGDRELIAKSFPEPKTLEGRVTGVADGDTLTVLDGSRKPHKIRLASIDAPESDQAFGTQAKKALSDKAFDKTVRVEWRELDKYGRVIGNVFVDDRWINKAMLEEGWAWHYCEYSKSIVLAEAEAIARAKDRGLWSDAKPTPRWEFRHPVVKVETPAEAPTDSAKPPATLLPLVGTSPPKNGQGEATVYVTSSGTKYHTAGCRHLAKSGIAMSLSDASARYQPCSVCHPPTAANDISAKKPATSSVANAKPLAPVNDPPKSRPSADEPVAGRTATGLEIHTGPRGGQYHYSKSGKKVYEKKK